MSDNGAAASGGNRFNPFSRREEFSSQALILHRICTLVTYLVFLVTAVYYTFKAPREGHKPRTTIWGNNIPTPFAQNSIITSIYWIVLFVLQLVYAWALYSANTAYLNAAANIGSHYLASNLLLFGFVHLWVRSHFWLAELLIVINFFNMSAAYFRHSTTPRLIHAGTVSGPLAWNFVALYWVGARAVHSDNLPARIVGNIFIWGFLVYGVFFLAAYKDYTMGFALSILAFSTAVGQFLGKKFELQWIFAFAIGGMLLALSLAVAFPALLGREPFPRGEIVSEDRERAPLLGDDESDSSEQRRENWRKNWYARWYAKREIRPISDLRHPDGSPYQGPPAVWDRHYEGKRGHTQRYDGNPIHVDNWRYDNRPLLDRSVTPSP